MHLAFVDYMAVNGKSSVHKASPHTKILMTILLIIAVIVADSPAKLGLILLYVIILIIISGANMKKIFHLALYPVFFSAIFALIKIQESYIEGLVVILKALSAAMSMLLLITTTPYIDIFAVLSIVLPSIIVDIFIFTYRSLFILLDKLESLLKIIRLKGGLHPLRILGNIRNLVGMLGILVIHSFDMSERMYRIYVLRGYGGQIPLTSEFQGVKATDIILIGMSAVIVAGVIIKWSI